jgi:8-oxo-dGTP pyrophosphatase MutT (NUDIX family)
METRLQTLARELHEELGVRVPDPRPLVVFDDLDCSGRWVRHVVFEGLLQEPVRAREGQQLDWWRPADPRPLAPPARRALAWGGF